MHGIPGQAGWIISGPIDRSGETQNPLRVLAGTGPLAAVLLAIRNEVSGSGLRSVPCYSRMQGRVSGAVGGSC